jgi:hypothetical protein
MTMHKACLIKYPDNREISRNKAEDLKHASPPRRAMFSIHKSINKAQAAAIVSNKITEILAKKRSPLDQWYSTFFVRVPPDIISLQLCTPKFVGV